jgi:hypothetical protein
MAKLQQEGIFKFQILDHGVKLTKDAQLPMWVVDARVIAIYDPTAEGWSETIMDENDKEVDLVSLDLQQRGWFMLVNDEGEDYQHVARLTGATPWDGQAFRELAELDLSKTTIIGGVNEGEYKGQPSWDFDWFDHGEADPNRKIGGLEADELDELDRKYGRKTAAKKTAAKAPKPKATAKPKADKPKADKPKAEKKKGGRPTVAKKEEPAKISDADVEALIPDGDIDVDQAYEICEKQAETLGITEERIGEIWVEQGEKLLKGDPETSDDCKKLATAVLKEVMIF